MGCEGKMSGWSDVTVAYKVGGYAESSGNEWMMFATSGGFLFGFPPELMKTCDLDVGLRKWCLDGEICSIYSSSFEDSEYREVQGRCLSFNRVDQWK